MRAISYLGTAFAIDLPDAVLDELRPWMEPELQRAMVQKRPLTTIMVRLPGRSRLAELHERPVLPIDTAIEYVALNVMCSRREILRGPRGYVVEPATGRDRDKIAVFGRRFVLERLDNLDAWRQAA